MVKSDTTMTANTLRRLESFFCRSKEKAVVLRTHPDVAQRLQTENKAILDDIAQRFSREIRIEAAADFHIHDIRIVNPKTGKELRP